MARTPFTLHNGEYYRDMYTIGNSRLVADMARQHQYEMDNAARINKDKLRVISWARVSPKFHTKYPYMKGKLKSDEEIFDFTDSRLINPPKTNLNNYPLVNVYVKQRQTHAPKLPLVQISYSYDPALFSTRPQHNYSNRQPKYNHIYGNQGETNTIPDDITASKTYRVRNQPYSITLGDDRNNYKSSDHTRQYGNGLAHVTTRQKTSSYPYHIFDKSGSVSAYRYPYDESKYFFTHPIFK